MVPSSQSRKNANFGRVDMEWDSHGGKCVPHFWQWEQRRREGYGASINDARSGWEEKVPKKQMKGTKSADLWQWQEGEGVKKSESFADVIYGIPLRRIRPLIIFPPLFHFDSFSHLRRNCSGWLISSSPHGAQNLNWISEILLRGSLKMVPSFALDS